MLTFFFGALTVMGLCYFVNFVFDDTLDPRTLLLGRLGTLAFCVGVVGLTLTLFKSC